jgi:hypothetical protein
MVGVLNCSYTRFVFLDFMYIHTLDTEPSFDTEPSLYKEVLCQCYRSIKRPK